MKVVIVGSGFGGIKTALELMNKPNISVQLLCESTHFEYHGALYRAATGRSPLEVVIPLRDIFAKATNIEIIQDRLTGMDAKKRRVWSESGNLYSYDKLVLALGLVPNFFGIKGMTAHAETLYTIKGAISLRHKLVQLAKAHVNDQAHVAIIGAGASGVELAGDIRQFIEKVEEKYGLPPVDVRVSLLEGGQRVLPLLSPKASVKAHERLLALNVATHLNAKVNACESGKVCLEADNLGADVIVWTAGSRNHPFFEENHSVFSLTKQHKVVVNDYLEAAPDVYVIGDNAATPYSGMAQTALHNAGYVAAHIEHRARGFGSLPYEPVPPIYVVPIGPRWAVVQSGTRLRTGYKGWLIRRRADLQIFQNFEPYEQAIKTWRKGNRDADF